jgi:hypothetical protein
MQPHRSRLRTEPDRINVYGRPCDRQMHPFGSRGMTRAAASFGGFVTRGSTEGER